MSNLAKNKRNEVETNIARWVYREQRPVTADEIAGRFNLSVYTTRKIIHAIMHRTDGTRSILEVIPTYIPKRKQMRPVKYFTIYYLPDRGIG